MEKKITKVERFNQLLALDEVKANADLVAFCEHEIDLLQKKSANKKPKSESEETMTLKREVASVLDDTPKTISEIIKANENLAGLSTQKLVPIMKLLVADEVAERVEEKGKALFIAK